MHKNKNTKTTKLKTTKTKHNKTKSKTTQKNTKAHKQTIQKREVTISPPVLCSMHTTPAPMQNHIRTP